MAAANPYLSMANQFASQYGIPSSIFDAQINAESGWNPSAYSSTGAIGLGQLEPGTAAQLGVNPYNTQQNLMGAAKYDAQLFSQYGNWNQALQAYNGGPGNVGSAQTQAYANEILSSAGVSTSGATPSTSSGSSTPYQIIINNSTGRFSVIPAGSPVPSGYTSGGTTPQSLSSAAAANEAATSACTSVVPGYCAISNFFAKISSQSLWGDIGAVVVGLIFLAGAFIASGHSINIPRIPLE